MNYKKLNAKEITRENEHISFIDTQTLGLQKQIVEICPIKKVYDRELEAKIYAHQQKIEILRFDKENDYSYKLALDKLNDLNKKIVTLRLNKTVHVNHIERGIPDESRDERARRKIQTNKPEDSPDCEPN